MTDTGHQQRLLTACSGSTGREALIRNGMRPRSYGTKSPAKSGWYTIPVEAEWVAKWKASKTPVYLVYVPVVSDPAKWVSHNGSSTRLAARASWVRVDQLPSTPSVRVPLENRLDADTLALWRDDFNNAFGGDQP